MFRKKNYFYFTFDFILLGWEEGDKKFLIFVVKE